MGGKKNTKNVRHHLCTFPKCDNQPITCWTGSTRPAVSWNLVTLKTNFAQYKNFVCDHIWNFLTDVLKLFDLIFRNKDFESKR